MVRIRGKIGDWPVDLTVELEPQEWVQLGQQLTDVLPAKGQVQVTSAVVADDHQWQTALELLRRAGSVEGPELLSQLAALAGGDVAGKRLLVRLRHCPQVKMETGADAPVYHWVG